MPYILSWGPKEAPYFREVPRLGFDYRLRVFALFQGFRIFRAFGL